MDDRLRYRAIFDDDATDDAAGGRSAAAPDQGLRAVDPGALRPPKGGASKVVAVELSKARRDWLRGALDDGGGTVEESAVLAVAVELVRELEVDWSTVRSAKDLRAAISAAVRIVPPDRR